MKRFSFVVFCSTVIASCIGAGLGNGVLSPVPGSSTVFNGGGSANNFTNTTLWNSQNSTDFLQFFAFGNNTTNFSWNVVDPSGDLFYFPIITSAANAGGNIYGYILIDPSHDGGAPAANKTEFSLVSGKSIALVPGAAGDTGRIQIGTPSGFATRMYFHRSIPTGTSSLTYSTMTEYYVDSASNSIVQTHAPGIFGRYETTNAFEQRWSLNLFGDGPQFETWTTNDINYIGNKMFYGISPSASGSVKFMGAQFVGKLETSGTNIFTVDTNGVNVNGVFSFTTNAVGGNPWIPIPGKIVFVTSNYTLYAVSPTKTNPVVNVQ